MQILTEAFLQALNMSFTAGIVILCVCLARLALRRAPGGPALRPLGGGALPAAVSRLL